MNKQFEERYSLKFSTLLHIPTSYRGDVSLNCGPASFYLNKETNKVYQYTDKFGWKQTSHQFSDFFNGKADITATNNPFVAMCEAIKKYYATTAVNMESILDVAKKFMDEKLWDHVVKVASGTVIITTPMILFSSLPGYWWLAAMVGVIGYAMGLYTILSILFLLSECNLPVAILLWAVLMTFVAAYRMDKLAA
jgi:hypothetical protein